MSIVVSAWGDSTINVRLSNHDPVISFDTSRPRGCERMCYWWSWYPPKHERCQSVTQRLVPGVGSCPYKHLTVDIGLCWSRRRLSANKSIIAIGKSRNRRSRICRHRSKRLRPIRHNRGGGSSRWPGYRIDHPRIRWRRYPEELR